MTIAQAEPLGGTARVDRIEPGDACGWAWFARVPEGISFMVTGDTLVRTNVDTTGFHSARGVGVASTEVQVLAAYAGRVRGQPHPYVGPEGHYLILAAGYVANLAVDWYRVTSFEGASGYFVIGLALVGNFSSHPLVESVRWRSSAYSRLSRLSLVPWLLR